MDIRANARDGSSEFVFDLGAILRAKPMDKGDDADVRTLYKPNGYVVSVRGDGTFTMRDTRRQAYADSVEGPFARFNAQPLREPCALKRCRRHPRIQL